MATFDYQRVSQKTGTDRTRYFQDLDDVFFSPWFSDVQQFHDQVFQSSQTHIRRDWIYGDGSNQNQFVRELMDALRIYHPGPRFFFMQPYDHGVDSSRVPQSWILWAPGLAIATAMAMAGRE